VTQGVRAAIRHFLHDRALQVLTAAALVAGTAAVAAPLSVSEPSHNVISTAIEQAHAAIAPPQDAPLRLVWEGADVDGDGKADFANPTGRETRTHDAYGDGEFGASRDGGDRSHEGVDFVAHAGQVVVAPISGYVTKIGLAYPGDTVLKFVEITNPALHYAARVFYVNPKVAVGEAVSVGSPIGTAHTLQRKYPGGMTDHVHLEVMDRRGARFAATEVITQDYVQAD
jgi:murein DD-endopeptidase MepM/ murein hydrolase activator NlpD